MAAKARDAQAGWSIYRASGYSFDLDEINERLKAAGFEPVAPRTYTHYRKLHRYGYQRYVPINQLDVETLRDPVWGGPLQTRFRPRSTSLDVRILATGEDGVFSLDGELVQLSEVEGTARVSVAGTPVAVDPATLEGQHVLALLAGESRAAVVDLVQQDPNDPTTVEATFTFLGVVSPEEVALGLRALGPSAATVVITTEEEDSPLVVLRQLYSLFEALDSARLVCDQVLTGLNLADEFTLPSARIRRLSIESPMLIELTVATAPLWVIAALVARWEYLRQKHYAANLTRGQADIADAQASILREQARALRIRNDVEERKQFVDPASLARYVIDAVRASLPSGTPQPDELEKHAKDRVAELTDKQLLPDVENLLDAPLVRVDIETGSDVPPLTLDDEEREEPEGS